MEEHLDLFMSFYNMRNEDQKAVLIERMQEKMGRFEKHFRQFLTRVPVAYFLCCLVLYKSTEESRREARSYKDPVLNAVPEVRPVDIGLFAGVLAYSKLSVIVRMVMKRKMKKLGIPEGHYRDWNSIRAWANGLCPKLLGAQARLKKRKEIFGC